MKRIFLLLFFFIPQILWCRGIDPVLEVINRVAPWAEGHVRVEQINGPKSVSGKSISGKSVSSSTDAGDAYEFFTKDGNLVIRATSIPAAGKAFNEYLKQFCHRSMSMTGENMSAPDEFIKTGKLPEVEQPVFASTDCRYRHFFNFCTLNYSASFWSWEEWQHMIDYMVLKGINLTISTVGLEKVWYNTLQQYNYSDQEIFEFLPGPAFNAWHIMGNLQGWGGPITKNLIEKRSRLGIQILNSLRRYGIEPITSSFYGMVPTTLKDKYPDADIIPQGQWVGGFDRPDILSPLDPLYKKISTTYYKELRSIYGKFKYFAGEPFHEGGNCNGIDVSDMSHAVFSQMRRYNPGCQWLLQSWGSNPTEDFLSSLSKEGNVMIWDFRGEQSAVWEERDGYYGFPFLWGTINNFGGTTGLYGKLERFVQEYYRSKEMYPGNMVGIGCSPEGLMNNSVNYELLFDLPWHKQAFDVSEWLRDYVQSRYGADNEAMQRVWEILLETAYSSTSDISHIDPISKELPQVIGTPESLVCASPSLSLKSTSSWGSSVIFYSVDKMKSIIPYLMEASEDLAGCDAFEYDLVDFTRQLLANDFYILYGKYVTSVKAVNRDAMKSISDKMVGLMEQMDALLSTRKEFMLGSWVDAARELGDSEYEKSLCMWNAKAQVTYWGGELDNTSLRDYAHKEWAGLISGLYIPRWKKFFQMVDAAPEGFAAIVSESVFTRMAIDWSHSSDLGFTEPKGDCIEVANSILKNIY